MYSSKKSAFLATIFAIIIAPKHAKFCARPARRSKMPFEHLRFCRHWDLSDQANYKLGQCQALANILAQMPLEPAVKRGLKQISMRKGAQATTAIEGNTLTEDEVEKILDDQPLAESKAYQEREVKNVLRAMNAIMDESADRNPPPITPNLLKKYHSFVGDGLSAPFGATPGEFAQSQRTVARYRCPPPGRNADQVEGLVDRLCKWLPHEFGFASGKQTFKDGIIEAIVTHVYIEWIHPFDDGNGRVGRLVEFYLLLRAGVPDICAHILSNHYNNTRPEYYAHIEKCANENDLTSFIDYAVTGFLDGLNEVWNTVSKMLLHKAWREHVDDKLRNLKWSKHVLERRKRLLFHMPLHKSYDLRSIRLASKQVAQAYASIKPDTLRRDIKELIRAELLVSDPQTGKFRANYLVLSDQYPNRII